MTRYPKSTVATDGGASYRKAETWRRIEPLQEQFDTLNQSQLAISQTVTQNLAENMQNNANLTSTLSCLEAKLHEVMTGQEALRTRISGFEEQIRELAVAPPSQEVRTEIVLPPVPLKRDKALAALTGTEVAVLEMLSKVGPNTAPEIK